MRVLVIGRHSEIMQLALARLREEGYDADGALDDDSARTRIAKGGYDAIAIGGGVEPASRAAIRAWTSTHLPRARLVDVFGADSLLARLKSTPERPS